MNLELMGTDELDRALRKKSETSWMGVGNDTITEMFNRASNTPYTPFDTGELRLSRVTTMINKSTSFTGIFGYNKDYAPHVEYGHRTRNGGYVPGQYYLKANIEVQKPLFRSRLIEELKK